MFSKSCQYALQSILYIVLHNKDARLVGLNEISESQKIPRHFLSKILQQLVKAKVLNSAKGPNGGFSMNKSPEKLNLMTVVKIVDGFEIFDRCGIGLKTCSDKNPCPIHFSYKEVKQRIKDLLSEKTLSELGEDVLKGKSIVSYR
jgi:Rrf2 family protein